MKLSIRQAGPPVETPVIGIAGSAERIVSSIHWIGGSGAPVSPGVGVRALRRFRLAVEPALHTAGLQRTRSSPLTPRETEILLLTAKGLSFGKVGDVLEISPHTVIAHVKRIYLKLAVHSRCEAVFEAGRLGLL